MRVSSSDPIRNKIREKMESMLQTRLIIPGLNFMFEDFIRSNKVPKVYVMIQDYPYIANSTYNIPFTDMNKKDFDDIFNIIINFSSYYRDKTNDGRDKTNSPMYHIVLRNILRLPRFAKYESVLLFVPEKGSNTSARINSVWMMYLSENINLFDNKNDNVEIKSDEIM